MSTEKFVDQLYETLLHRTPDEAGKALWVEAIDYQNVSALSVTREFLDSAEFQAEVSDICKLYYAFFDRIPDSDGLSAWVNYARDGHSLESIADGFINSAEFIGRYGADLDDESFIEAIYSNVLGRSVDAAGLSSWTTALMTGTGRDAFAVSIARSTEAAERLDSKVQSTAAWYGILGRAPQAAELENRFYSLELQLKALYVSSEYAGEAVPGLTDDTPSILSAHYDTDKNELTLSGSGLNQLLEPTETNQTDISSRMSESVLGWYMGNGDRREYNEAFSRDDIVAARIESDTSVIIQFTDEKAASLESKPSFGSEVGYSGMLDRLAIYDSLLGEAVTTDGVSEIAVGYDQVFYSKSYEETIIGTDGEDRFVFAETLSPFNWDNAKGSFADVSYVDVLAVTAGDRIDISDALEAGNAQGLDGLVEVQAGADITPLLAVEPFSNGEGGQVSVQQGVYHAGVQVFESSVGGSDLFVTIADQGDWYRNKVIVLTGTNSLSDVTDGILTV